MRNPKLATGSGLSIQKIMKSQLIRKRSFRAAVFFSLLTIAAIFFTLNRSLITNIEAQQATADPNPDATAQINAARQEITGEKESKDQSIEPASQVVGDCGWTNSTEYPGLVAGQSVATMGNILYSFGGLSEQNTIPFSFKFNGTTWTQIAPLPLPLGLTTAVSDGTYIYIIGGLKSNGVVNTLYRYDPTANTYTTLAPLPAATYSAAAVYLNGKIYHIGGGLGGSDLTDKVVVYDIAGNTWSEAASYPTGLTNQISAFAFGNYVYTAGGVSRNGGVLTKTYRYDPTTNIWDDAAIADLPAGAQRAGASVASYADGAIFAGGDDGSVNYATDTAFLWNASINRWLQLPNQLARREYAAAGVIGNNFYNIGGNTSVAFQGSLDNQKLCIPAPATSFQGNVTYTSESGTPINNTPDPGETVTVNLNLQNIGAAPTAATTATLQATGGVIPVTTTQSFGVLAINGAAVSRSFTFTVPANAACGNQVTLTFAVSDGTTTTSITKTYSIGVQTSLLSENFDGVTAPALPAGWTSAQTGTSQGWVTTNVILNSAPNSAPNSAYAPNLGTGGGADLISPAFNVGTIPAVLNFRLYYHTFRDGGILQIKIGTGAFQEITAAGGVFTQGGYDNTVGGVGNPLGETFQPGWSGFPEGFYNVSVKLPPAASGQSVQFKWRFGNNSDGIYYAAGGLWIDNVAVNTNYLCSTVGVAARSATRADFDGDGKADISVFRPSDGIWYINRSQSGFTARAWGTGTDILVPGDYDGDGKTDMAVARPNAENTGLVFYILNSGTSTATALQWGAPSDIPQSGDYNNDGKADVAVFRPSNGTWYINFGGGGSTMAMQFGQSGDVPVAADYDGDGKTDLAVIRGNIWYINQSTGGIQATQFGSSGDKPVPADYDGDGKINIAVYRPSNGTWYTSLDPAINYGAFQFGNATDVPVAGDYDGDGKADIAVYRNGIWYMKRSTTGFSAITFGLPTDKPVPAR